MKYERKEPCPIRHENGNCTCVGGFCTAVPDHVCECIRSAYDCGWTDCALKVRKELRLNPSTIEVGQKWTSTEERLPVEEAIQYARQHSGLPEYLVCIKGEAAPTTLYFAGDGWADGECNYYPVTHWMPLPEMPKEG